MSAVSPKGQTAEGGNQTFPPFGASQQSCLRAYSDPVIFKDDRVLKTLLRKESKYLPSCRNYFIDDVQSEVKPQMRKEVADWMLAVCEDRQSHPEVFCLAMNYLDRFLSVCSISRSQLQLLGAVCLLVAWKVREHEPLPAARLVEYSDHNLTLLDIMEWEVLLLSKLDWDMSAVIAFDYVEHIIHQVSTIYTCICMGADGQMDKSPFQSLISPETLRQHSETLISMCAAHYRFSALSPCLVAAACVLTTLRPRLEAAVAGTSLSDEGGSTFDIILNGLQQAALLEKNCVLECVEEIERLMSASLPQSPSLSPLNQFAKRMLSANWLDKRLGDECLKTPEKPGDKKTSIKNKSHSGSLKEKKDDDEETTPTKVLVVAGRPECN